jgi:hypothetical protein
MSKKESIQEGIYLHLFYSTEECDCGHTSLQWSSTKEQRKYKGPSIISGTGAAIWTKLTLGLLATVTLEVFHFRAYAPFLTILTFLKCILEFVFYEDVHHRLREITGCQLRRVGWVGDELVLFLVKNSLVKKEV